MSRESINILGNFNPVTEIKSLLKEDHLYDREEFLINLCSTTEGLLCSDELLRIMNKSRVKY